MRAGRLNAWQDGRTAGHSRKALDHVVLSYALQTARISGKEPEASNQE